ncbi:MAG: prolyl oligopeptidase family serine peptidase [Planctomycetes bacterium]|nr:prolyl oligopeptidase family serine peptidase [Planctomycetota bacterium]
MVSTQHSPLTAGSHLRHIRVGGVDRKYLVHLPPQYDPAVPSPVVLAFHGYGSSSHHMVKFCDLSTKADQAGFVVVYPEGTGKTRRTLAWNAGDCCGDPQQDNTDDVGFVRALLDDLGSVASVDPRRMFAAGMSNGAMMAYFLALKLSDRIAAIAAVSGPMGTCKCQPKRPVPVMHFHGLDDKFAPFLGGVGERSITKVNFLSVPYSVDFWVRANQCSPDPVVSELPACSADGTSVLRKVWGGGRNDSEVILFEISGGGHTWPGARPMLFCVEATTQNVSANDEMWRFFQRHPLPDSC